MARFQIFQNYIFEIRISNIHKEILSSNRQVHMKIKALFMFTTGH